MTACMATNQLEIDMNTEQFTYWLQGFVEIHGAPPSAEQWQMIKDHLQTCFVKVTPQRQIGQPTSAPGGVGTGTIPDWLRQMPGTGHPPGTIIC